MSIVIERCRDKDRHDFTRERRGGDGEGKTRRKGGIKATDQ